MKKRRIRILLVSAVCTATLIGCGNTKQTESAEIATTQVTANQKVEQVTIQGENTPEVSITNNQPEEQVKLVMFEGDLFEEYEELFSTSELEFSVEYHYNENGLKVERAEFVADESKKKEIQHREVYEYDEEGREIREYLYYGPGDTPVTIMDSEYNEKGQMIRCYDARECFEEYKYEYDANGKLIKVVSIQDGIENKTICYEYDSNGLCIKEISSDDDGVVDRIIEKTYDTCGNIIRESMLFENGDIKNSNFLYQYDEENRILKEVSSSENTSYFYQYQYDGDGTLMKKIEISSDGNRGNLRTYFYDDNGNITKELIQCYEINDEGMRVY